MASWKIFMLAHQLCNGLHTNNVLKIFHAFNREWIFKYATCVIEKWIIKCNQAFFVLCWLFVRVADEWCTIQTCIMLAKKLAYHVSEFRLIHLKFWAMMEKFTWISYTDIVVEKRMMTVLYYCLTNNKNKLVTLLLNDSLVEVLCLSGTIPFNVLQQHLYNRMRAKHERKRRVRREMDEGNSSLLGYLRMNSST